mgnify:CR=1 FL=1
MTDAGLKLLAFGLAIGFGAIGPGIGIGLAASGALQAMGRNPDAVPIVQTNMIVGFAFCESIAIYALVVAFIIRYAS